MIDAAKIWWEHVGSSIRLREKLAAHLRNNKDLVFLVHDGLPWQESFYESLDKLRHTKGDTLGIKKLDRSVWVKDSSSGRALMQSFCTNKVVTDYWLGEKVGKYLGSLGKNGLSNAHYRICGIRTEPELIGWLGFIADYRKALSGADTNVSFLLEYGGGYVKSCPIEIVDSMPALCDVRVFCIDAVSELGNTDLPEYQAELALNIGGLDLPLCGKLMECGMSLLEDPLNVACKVIKTHGKKPDDTEISSAIWRSLLILLFPIIEEVRMRIIREHHDLIKIELKQTPVYDYYGDKIYDPYALEAAQLFFLMNNQRSWSEDLRDQVRLCRDVRNSIAHIDKIPLPLKDVRAVLSMKNS